MNADEAGAKMPPQDQSVEELRAERKLKLAAALRAFGKFGFDEGVAGHITVRDPEHLDHFWVNPMGRSFKAKPGETIAMWRQLLAATVAVLLVAPESSAVQKKSRSGPVMEIEPEDHDFGGVQQNQKLVHEFIVNNVGTEDLEILRIATSCGCTAAIPADRIVAPGGSTTLEVTLETRKYVGVVQKSISVASNDRQVVRTIRVHAFVEE